MQPQVQRLWFNDPMAGFAVILPEDFEIGTSLSGQTMAGVNARYIGSFFAPWFSFTYTKHPPQASAAFMAQMLKELGGQTEMGPTKRPDEWLVYSDVAMAAYGRFICRFVFRRSADKHYVISATVPADLDAQFQDDILTALSTCRPIPFPVFKLYEEPTEHAYKIRLPEKWKWEGSIYRSTLCPGYFVWKAMSPDGLVGCFESAPLEGLPGFCDAKNAASTVIFASLREHFPDLAFVGFKEYPRAGDQIGRTLMLLVRNSLEIRSQKASAFYTGMYKGARLLIKVDISQDYVKNLLSSSSTLRVCGAWAPADAFEKLYPMGYGVLTSLRPSREWIRRNDMYTKEALDYRTEVFERALEKWSEQSRTTYYDHVAGKDVVMDMSGIDHCDVVRGSDGDYYYYDSKTEAEMKKRIEAGEFSVLTRKP
jgi:hypothetical protein